MPEENWPSWSTGLRKSAVEIERVVDPPPADAIGPDGAGVCAQLAKGHFTAPPSREMNSRRSFDHLVGAQEKGFRDRQPDCLGSRQIDDKIELGRLLDRDIGGGCAPRVFCHLFICAGR